MVKEHILFFYIIFSNYKAIIEFNMQIVNYLNQLQIRNYILLKKQNGSHKCILKTLNFAYLNSIRILYLQILYKIKTENIYLTF